MFGKKALNPVDNPVCNSVERFALGVGCRPSAPCRNPEAMVCMADKVKRCPSAQARDDGPQQVQLGERIAVAGDEQHGHFDPRKMPGAFDPRPAGRMQREAEEGEPLYPR